MKMSIESDHLWVENFEKICRACLAEGDMEPLFKTCPKDVCLIEKIMSCTFIQINENDGLPVNICLNCVKEINQAYTFAKKCENSDVILRKCILKSSKHACTELNKNDDNIPAQKSPRKLKLKIKPVRKNLKRRISLETKDNQPLQTRQDKETNEEEKIKVKHEDEAPLEESYDSEQKTVDFDYIKLETAKPECDEFSDSNDNYEDLNNDSDYTPDKSETDEPQNLKESSHSHSSKKINRKRSDRSIKDKDCENNWEDDFSWNADSPSEKKDIKQRKKRRGTPRRQGPPFICKRCDLTFESHEEIVAHRTKVRHYPPKNKPCPICAKLFTTWKLKSHMRTHTKERPYLCSFCGKGFTLDTNLRRHLMIHTGERPHKCHLCDKAFIQMTQLQDHLRVHSGETPFVCSVCGKSFKQPSVLRLHMKYKHSEDGDSGDKRKREGVTTKSSIDPNAIPEHECPTCNKRYHTKAVLNQHILTHGEKRFLCSDCGKGFISKASLQVHSKIHSGIRPYSCQVCGKSFSQMGTLQMHNLIHTGEKPNVCLVCNKSFTQPSHLKYHMRTHTGEKPYSCTVCGKNFSTSGTLTVHKRTHTGETPYLCPICGKGFYDSSSMKKHKRRHGEQNTQC